MQTEEMKNIYKWGWYALIALVVFLAISSLAELKDLRNTSPSYNTITVSGEGEVFAVPDVASFSFTVSADAETVAAAQEDAAEKMEAVLEAMRGMGIEEKDIKTMDYSVYPRYSYTQGACTPMSCPPLRQVLEGYTASQNVSVKVRDTEKAGEALSLAGANGATGLSSISFTIDDPEELMREARQAAIEDAKEKAEVLSDELDVRIVRVVSFSDSSDEGVPPFYRVAMGGMDMEMAEAQKAPSIPTGENKMRVIVHVTYEIR